MRAMIADVLPCPFAPGWNSLTILAGPTEVAWMTYEEDRVAAFEAASRPSKRLGSAVLGGMGVGVLASALGGAVYSLVTASAIKGVGFMRRSFPLLGAVGIALNLPTIQHALQDMSNETVQEVSQQRSSEERGVRTMDASGKNG
ncbi:hypothetical protein GUITHDRAFT_109787 [Guillardia theta CCMP2712]|uniref:Uncharacterized protein n=1 Tax=Guillardia theta (strain CCMP2712) TaxID=905079 RepID=L1J749_GUITC|nr:hypothetical protein GUITHDRAFT_109787 [Guillardia theta CCMP2712]EKX44336.1 hypothetical protein GUITHDRAFT_109787 [Guillardia theta CCMP2712]|eukprot:XP_005831316.1 hypothetical protein GUITHDRAFT_109787 [Guillardia theta CCMP2712]